MPLATMQELARHWAGDYDWRRCEARLNALPQFVTEIDGLDIHFIHVRSPHEADSRTTSDAPTSSCAASTPNMWPRCALRCREAPTGSAHQVKGHDRRSPQDQETTI